MCQTEAQREAEEVLCTIGDVATLKLIARIRKLECENRALREKLAQVEKSNGGDQSD